MYPLQKPTNGLHHLAAPSDTLVSFPQKSRKMLAKTAAARKETISPDRTFLFSACRFVVASYKEGQEMTLFSATQSSACYGGFCGRTATFLLTQEIVFFVELILSISTSASLPAALQ